MSKTTVECYIPPVMMKKSERENHSHPVELYNPETNLTVASTNLTDARFVTGHDNAKFLFDYNDAKIFEPLKCRLDGVSSSNVLNISFQLCK